MYSMNRARVYLEFFIEMANVELTVSVFADSNHLEDKNTSPMFENEGTYMISFEFLILVTHEFQKGFLFKKCIISY